MPVELTHPATGLRYTAPRCAPLAGTAAPACDLTGAGRLLLLGDTHGDVASVVAALRAAADVGAAAVVQVGDFGLWPGGAGSRFLEVIDSAAAAAGVPVLVVPGNHDDYDLLAAADVDTDGWLVIASHVRAAPRGHVFAAGGRTLLACGGAASPDGPGGIFGPSRGPVERLMWRCSRPGAPAVPYEEAVDLGGWWPQELVTDVDVAVVDRQVTALEAAGGHIDVLLTHDVPAAVPMSGASSRRFVLGDIVRERLDAIARRCRPAVHVAGHWHQFKDTRYLLDGDEVRMVVLSADVNPAEPAAVVLELATLDLADVPPRR